MGAPRTSQPPRVAIIVQRYGTDVIGGAEAHARMVAEHLQQDLGWDITVLTTTARDYRTWQTHYQPGATIVNGVKVWRAPILWPRLRIAFGIYDRVLRLAQPVLRIFGERIRCILEIPWYALQGPFCPDLLRELRARRSEFDALIFYTYLYYPTARVLPKLSGRILLIPTLHDEPAAHFATTKLSLRSSARIFCSSSGERDLVLRLCPDASTKTAVTRIGISVPSALSTHPEPMHEPFALYVGRLNRDKGVDVLADYFVRNAPEKMTLRLAGQGELNFANSLRIKALGSVSDDVKWELLCQCSVVINPSPHESLSFLVLEGILARKPVVVNGRCPVLRDYARLYESVFAYEGEADFRKALNAVFSTDWTLPEHKRKLDFAHDAVRDEFSWQKVLQSYQAFITQS